MYINLEGGKKYYKISEVAKLFDVNISLIRFWEKEFEQIQPKKNQKGNRSFTIKDIEIIELIYFLVKEKRFTLEGARKELQQNFNKTVNNLDLIRRLEFVQKELKDIYDHL